MTENKVKTPFQPEILFGNETERQAYLNECYELGTAAIEKVPTERRQVPLDETQIRTIQENGLNLYEQLIQIPLNEKKRSYPSAIDVVHVYSGPHTSVSRGMEVDEAGQFKHLDRSRDYDRVLLAIAITHEVARQRALESGVEVTEGAMPDILNRYAPFLMYNGQPHENEAFRQFIAKDTFPNFLPREKIVVTDTAPLPSGDRVNIKHTGHQVSDFVWQCTDQDGTFNALYDHRVDEGNGLTVAVVSHNSGIIRIPWYFGDCAQIGAHGRGEKGSINMYLYGMRDRSYEQADYVLKRELASLAQYAVQGFLATEPYPYEIPVQ